MTRKYKYTKKTGRPLFDGKDEKTVLQKLEDVFEIGGSDAEACLHADISTGALYAYQKAHPEFLKRKEALKQTPFLTARANVVSALKDKNNPEFALKYLERKLAKEFGAKQQIEHSGEVRSMHLELVKIIKEIEGVPQVQVIEQKPKELPCKKKSSKKK